MKSGSKTNSATATVATAAYVVAFAAGMPVVMGATPAARWGHQAVYVKSKQAMYVVGGEVPTSSSQITNEVLVLPLNSTNPTFSTGDSTGLPPHAFASLATTKDGSSLILAGGMTTSCGSDGTTHTLDLGGGRGWTSTTPSRFVRRRGAGAAWVDDGSSNGKFLVVGGIADEYSCASSTYAFPATDVLSLPLSSGSLVSTRSLPSSLTGSTQAVSDFALATDSNGKVYLTGGQSASGQFVDMTTVGVWDSKAGWSSQETSGDVPSGRVGASLVAHPSLDLLVLHGGSTDSSGSATSLLSLLNTTSWTWSTPSNLQPPSSSATSYHTSVMTEQGVMITAFGLSSSGSPRSDVYYLDMRDPTGSGWTWKSNWDSNMLSEYTASGSTPSTGAGGNGGNTGTVNTAKDDAQSGSGMSGKKIASITVPILIIALILSPIIIYLIRRRMRVIKKRRMARHFSFSSQEDEGGFSSNPFQQYMAKRRTKTQFPFGRDANEKDGNIFTDVSGGLSRMITRLSDRSNSDGGHEQQREREMIEVHRSPKVRFDDSAEVNGSGGRTQPMNWEEIDFGLGKLDESKHLDPSYETLQNQQNLSSPFGDHAAVPTSASTSGPTSSNVPFPMPMSNQGYAPEMLYNDDNVAPHYVGRLNVPNAGAPVNDGPAPFIPSLTVQPATAPATPAVNPLSSAYPAMVPTPASAVGGSVPTDGMDWNQLQQDLDSKPAFRSISPTAQLRSHAHAGSQSTSAVVTAPQQLVRKESPRPASPAPSLPPLDFQTQNEDESSLQRQPSSASSTSSNGTIRLVNPQLSLGYGRRPQFLPFEAGSRSVSQPQPIGRQLAGGLNRRGSAPYSETPANEQSSPTSSNSSRPLSLSYTPGMRRSASSTVASPGGGNGSPVAMEKRASMLRVVNVTESEGEARQ